MKLHTTNYKDTFIMVADDCMAKGGEIPPTKNGVKTAASIQFDLISACPYTLTSDDVLFQVYAKRNELTESELPSAKEQFFSKGQPCFRASPLTKRYGWGVHHNQDGKIALIGCETPEYRSLATNKDLKIFKAMRSRK